MKVLYLLQPNNFKRRCQFCTYTVQGINIRWVKQPIHFGCLNNERFMFNLSDLPEMVRQVRVINEAASPFLIKTSSQYNNIRFSFLPYRISAQLSLLIHGRTGVPMVHKCFCSINLPYLWSWAVLGQCLHVPELQILMVKGCLSLLPCTPSLYKWMKSTWSQKQLPNTQRPQASFLSHSHIESPNPLQYISGIILI